MENCPIPCFKFTIYNTLNFSCGRTYYFNLRRLALTMTVHKNMLLSDNFAVYFRLYL